MTQPLPIALRRFGTRLDDLDADFDAARPYVITDLLARCAREPGQVHEDWLWDLPAGRRIAAVLVLAGLSGVRQFDVDVACAKCGLALEVTLGLEELLETAGAIPTEVSVEHANQSGRYRLPTGRDQIEWLAHVQEGESSLMERFVASLRIEGEVPLDALEAALDHADPLVRTAVTAVCPQCGHSNEEDLDLAGRVLAGLEAEQRHLLWGVHLLASHYHWSEAEIFALPPWRRERYLSLLSKES